MLSKLYQCMCSCKHEHAGKTKMSSVFSKQMRSAWTYLSQRIYKTWMCHSTFVHWITCMPLIEYTLQEYKSIFLTDTWCHHECDLDFSRGMSLSTCEWKKNSLLRTYQSLFTVNQQMCWNILIHDHGEKKIAVILRLCVHLCTINLMYPIKLKAFSRLTFDLGSLLCFQQIRYLSKSKFSLSIHL